MSESSPQAAPYAWLPTPDDVAALLRARTKDSGGHELGAWSDDTRPTADEVTHLIDLAAEYVVGAASEPTAVCAGSAASATAIRAAMLVELSYFPEQVRSDRSAYTELKQLYDEAQASLISCISAGGGGDGGGAGYTFHSLPITPATLEQGYAVG